MTTAGCSRCLCTSELVGAVAAPGVVAVAALEEAVVEVVGRVMAEKGRSLHLVSGWPDPRPGLHPSKLLLSPSCT